MPVVPRPTLPFATPGFAAPADAPPAEAQRARDAGFEREVLACLPDVARFARALTHDGDAADDLVQETMLQAYRGYHTFHPGADARRWLFTICRHAFLRQRARDGRTVAWDAVAETIDADGETLAAVRDHAAARREGIDDLFDRIDVAPAIDRAVAALPEAFRLAVAVVDLAGLSYEEAAAVLGVPVGTVRSRLFRARRLLQRALLQHARDAGLAPRVADPVHPPLP